MEEVLILRTVIDNKESIKGINNFKKVNKELKKALEQSSDTGSEGFAAISQVAEETGKTFEEVKSKLRDTFQENQQEIRLFNRTLKESSELGSGSILELREEVKRLTREYDNLDEETREGAFGTDLRDSINDQVEALKELESQTGRNQRNVGNYESAVEKLNDKIKIAGVSVNDLKDAYKENSEILKTLLLGKQADAVATNAQASATRGAAVANSGLSKSLRILRVALIATGIGAIVVLLGSLVAAFLSTQRGANAVTRTLEPLKAIFNSLIGVLQNLSFKFVDAFKNPKEALKSLGDAILTNVINRFKGLGEIIQGLIDLDFDRVNNGVLQSITGVEDLTGKIKGAADEAKNFLNEAAQVGQKIANLRINLASTEAKFLEDVGKLTREFKAQNLIAEDTTKSLAEREKATLRTIDIQKEINKLNQNRTAQEVQLQELINSTNDTSYEAQTELAELKKKQAEQDASALEAITTQNNKLNTIRTQGRNEAKKAADERKKVADDEVKLEEERLEKLRDLVRTEEERLINQKKIALNELGLSKEDTELTKLELEAKKQIEQKYALEIEQLRKSSDDKIIEQARQRVAEALQVEEKANVIELLKLEEAYLKKVALAAGNEEELKALRKKYNKDKLALIRTQIQDEINLINNLINDRNADGTLADAILTEEQKEELKRRLQEVQTELARTDAQLANIGIDQETGEKKSFADRLGLTDEQAAGIKASYESAMAGVASILHSANEFITLNTEKRISDIDDALERGVISEEQAEDKKDAIRKEAAKKQQKLQIAIATIQFLQGLISAWSQAMTYTFPFNLVVGAISTAALGAAYGVNIAKIKSQKYEKGGVLKGKSHKQGGIKTADGQYEFEGDEGIIKKTSMQNPKLRALASYSNEKTGGVKFGSDLPIKLKKELDNYVGSSNNSFGKTAMSVRGFYRDGGAVPSFTNATINGGNQRDLASSTNDRLDAVIEELRTNKPSSVAVTEINEGQNDVDVIELKSEN
jgi:hypothetical protein